MTQPARVLEAADVRRLLRHVKDGPYPERDCAMALLSFKAGLRACEIAGLDWTMVLRPDGTVGDRMYIAARIAKYGSARTLPFNRELKEALVRLHRTDGRPLSGPVIRSKRGTHLRPHSVVNWFRATYASLGLAGCSSHSGRRTFITRSARLLPKVGGSLRDVQELAGHRALTVTERYIQGDRDVQRRLLRLI